MSEKFKLGNFLGFNDPEEVNDNSANTVREVRSNPRKVVDMKENRIPNSNISIYEPRVYGDSKGIANKLMTGNAVIVKLDQVTNDSARRIIDFLNGTIYAIDGTIKRIDERIFLCAPKNFDVNGMTDASFNNTKMD